MIDHLLLFLCIFVPLVILLYNAAEIYFRDRKDKLHRLTALLILMYFGMFLGYFLEQVLPEHKASFAVRYVVLLSSFMSASLGQYFIQKICKPSVHPFFLHTIALMPVVGVVCLLSDPPWLVIDVYSGPIWRSEVHSVELDLLTMGLTAFSMICSLTQLVLANRRLKLKPWLVQERKRVKLFLAAIPLLITWIVLTALLKPLLLTIPMIWPDILTSYSVFFYVFTFRYAMVNYGFLSTTGRRYEILFNDSPNGIAILNEERRLLDANPAYLRLIGILDRDDHSWKNAEITDFVTLLEHGESVRQIEYSFREKRPLQIVGSMTNRLNETYVVEQTLNFFESDGQILSFATVKDITMQKESEQNLAYLAYHDPLTGLYNRRRFYEIVNEQLNLLEGTDGALAVLLIDLDEFKGVNDSLGHSAGDELLRIVAKRLVSTVPENSCIARMGGDEFVILLLGLQSEDEAESVARQLNDKLRESIFIKDRALQITASIGISMAPRDGSDTETLIGSADAAMYGTKREWRLQFLNQQI